MHPPLSGKPTAHGETDYDFVGGNYDRYMASVHGEGVGSLKERAISSLQLHSYKAIRDGIREGVKLDQQASERLVAPGGAGIQARADRLRAIARLTRDKPSLADVRAAKDSIAETEKKYAGDLRAHCFGSA